MMKYLLICNDVEMAQYMVACGLDRVFIDLEIMGKKERQGHLDTHITDHRIEDVKRLRDALPTAHLLTRINPLHENTREEIEEVIASGASSIMLPMFHSPEDIQIVGEMIARRVPFIPLFETPESIESFDASLATGLIDEVYVGLNDLHLALKRRFMFETLIDGTLDHVFESCRQNKIPFGFGGIARVGEGKIPGETVLSEHYRLGSQSVILSRTFHRSAKSLNELKKTMDFEVELQKLREAEKQMAARSSFDVEKDREAFSRKIEEVMHELA